MKYFVAAVGTALIVVMGMMIDAQSHSMSPRQELPAQGPSIFAPGIVEGASEEVELRTQLRGRILKILVHEGQLVSEGDVLVQIDDAQYRHEVELAEAERYLAEARLTKLTNGAREEERRRAKALYEAKRAHFEQADLTWRRIKQLQADGAITQQEADDQRTSRAAKIAEVEAARAELELLNAPPRSDEVHMAKAEIAATEAKLDLARTKLEQSVLRAPIAGQVLRINVQSGELSGPNSPEPAVIIADTRQYRVRAFVEELDAPRVAVGMKAKVTADGLPGETFAGTVVRLSPRMYRKQLRSDHPAEFFDTKVRELWIEMEAAQGLVVGLRVDVVIDLVDSREKTSQQ